MNPDRKFESIKGNQHHIDPTAHRFHFSEAEIAKRMAELMKKGMTEMEASIEVALQEQTAIEKLNPAHKPDGAK